MSVAQQAGEFFGMALQGIGTVLGTWVTANLLPRIPAITRHAFEWLGGRVAQVRNERLKGVLTMIGEQVSAKVHHFEATEIEALKEMAAAGKLTKEGLKERYSSLGEKFRVEIREQLSVQGLWKDALAHFGNDPAALLAWIEGQKERYVSFLEPSGLQTEDSYGRKPVLGGSDPALAPQAGPTPSQK